MLWLIVDTITLMPNPICNLINYNKQLTPNALIWSQISLINQNLFLWLQFPNK